MTEFEQKMQEQGYFALMKNQESERKFWGHPVYNYYNNNLPEGTPIIPENVPYANSRYGKDVHGNQYFIDSENYDWDPGYYYLNDVFLMDDDDFYYNYNHDNKLEVVPWSRFNDGSTLLDEVQVYPKTGTLILSTFYPGLKYLPGHSMADLVPDFRKSGAKYGWVDKGIDAKDYNLVTNNCADGTCELLETVFGEKLNPWFFTTPGDVRDFAKKHGYYPNKDGEIRIPLSEEQYKKAWEKQKELKRRWGYSDNRDDDDE